MTELLLAQSPSDSQTMRYDSLVRDIKYYVSTHLNENLSVKTLAERGYMLSLIHIYILSGASFNM